MNLQTVVKNMVTAKEPEANIAKVIQHYNQINSSPLKAIEGECGEGWTTNDAGECVPIEKNYGSSIQEKGSRQISKAEAELYRQGEEAEAEAQKIRELEEAKEMESYISGKTPIAPDVEGVTVTAQAPKESTEETGADVVINNLIGGLPNITERTITTGYGPGNMPIRETIQIDEENQKPDPIAVSNALGIGDTKNNNIAVTNLISDAYQNDELISSFQTKVLEGSKDLIKAEEEKIRKKYNLTPERKEEIANKYIAKNQANYDSEIAKIFNKHQVGTYKNGKLYINEGDEKDPDWITRNEQAQKEAIEFINNFKALALGQDEQLLKDDKKANEDFLTFQNQLITDTAKNSPVYNKRVKEIQNKIINTVDAANENYLEKVYGSKGWRELRKAMQEVVPQQWTDGGNYFTWSDIEGVEKEIEKVKSLKPMKDGRFQWVNNSGHAEMIGPEERKGYKTKEEVIKRLRERQQKGYESAIEAMTKSEEFQNNIDKFEKIEFFDQDGITFDDILGSSLEQVPQMAMAVLTLGGHTFLAEAGAIAKESLGSQGALEFARLTGNDPKEFFNLPMADSTDSEGNVTHGQAHYMYDLVKQGKGNLDKAFKGGLLNAGIDLVGNFLVIGGAKVPLDVARKSWKMFVNQNLINIGKQTGKAALRTGAPVLGETLAEVSQEIVSDIQTDAALEAYLVDNQDSQYNADFEEVTTPDGKQRFKSTSTFDKLYASISDPQMQKDLKEVAAKTVFSTGGLLSVGRLGSSTYDSWLKTTIPYLESGEIAVSKFENTVIAGYNKRVQDIENNPNLSRVQKREKIQELSTIKLEQLAAIKEANNFINSNALRGLDKDKKLKVIKAQVRLANQEKKMEGLNKRAELYKDKELPLTLQNEIKQVKNQIDKNQEQIYLQRGLQLMDEDAIRMIDIVNNSKEKNLKNKSINLVKSIADAKEVIDVKKDEIKNNTKLTDKEKAIELGKLESTNIKELLDGDATGVVIGNEALIIKDNVVKNTKLHDLSATNVINHEVSHFVYENASKKELKAIQKEITNKIEESGDKKMLNALNYANAKVKGKDATYAKQIKEDKTGRVAGLEFIAALSDGMRDAKIRDLSLENESLFNNFANIFNKQLNKNSDGKLKFNFDAKNAFEFIKKFNNVKSDKIDYSFLNKPSKNKKLVLPSKPLEQKDIAVEFKNSKKGEISDELAIQAAYAYEPLAKSVASKLYKTHPEYAEQGYTLDDFTYDLTYGKGANSLRGLAKAYDPKIGSIGGWFDKYLPERAKAVAEKNIGKQATTGATKIDTKEAKEIQDTKKPFIESEKPIIERLGIKSFDKIGDKTVDLGLINVTKQIGKLGPKATIKQKISKKEKGIADIVKREYAPLIKKEVLKKDFIDKKWKSLGDIYLENTDISKIRNPQTKELLESWLNDGFTKEDIADYFNDPNVPANTRSDRKNVGLVNAIIAGISNEAIIEKAKKDPKTAKDFKNKNLIPLASKPLDPKTAKYLRDHKDAPQVLTYPDAKALLKSNKLSMPTFETPEGIKSFFENITPLALTLPKKIVLEKSFYSGGDRGKFKTKYHKGKKSNKTATKEDKKLLQELKDTYNIEQNKLFDKIKANKNQPEFHGLAQDGVQKSFDEVWGTNVKEIKKNINKGLDSNVKNLAIHEQTWVPLYNAVLQNPKQNLPLVAKILSASGETARNWHRLGGEMVAFSKDLSSGIRFEHAMPAKAAYLALLESAAKGVPFDIAYPAVMKNYKVIALALKDDKKIQGPYKSGMGEGWNFYTDSWLERYFNPYVAAFDGGINPNSIETFDGQTIKDLYKIDSNGIENPTLLSKPLDKPPLDKDFNDILERSQGIKSEYTYSEGRARKIGEKKGFLAFVPYSAEDYLGLVYPTLGKGKQGDKDLQWYKDNLMDPYNNGMRDFEISKQNAVTSWNELKKQIKNTPTNLKKEAVRGFNNEDAIRIYLWNKSGNPPTNLAKKDLTEINKYINSKPELQAFANQVEALGSQGYPAPNNNWLAGTITTDLVNHVNTVTRSEYLQPWQEAVDEIYTAENKNKLRAAFGNNYVEALEDSLYRMKTGRNRPAGTNRITNTWLNWVNDSVGTVMFLNQRSALLQTISSINYMNWGDNNPAKVAMAFANQKQFWSDFAYIFNSDFLKQRRSGLKTDVNADEIANSAATSNNKARAAASWILKQGFLPTQIADSFAISMGGASFYRNRVNKYKKEGLNQKEAEEKAFLDFRDTTTESQQSADPSRISMQQAGPLGRLILAFANTPIQYTRLTKRAIQDLKNGRGDWKTNVSKILYYGAVQNVIFTTLQQALFGMLFDDDDEDVGEKEAKFKKDRKEGAVLKIVNSAADTLLRGSGVGGAFIAMLKNLALEVKKQSDKPRSDYERVADKLFSFSPVIDAKFRKLQSAGRTFTYKQELKKIQERGLAIDNPALLAIAQVLSAFTNVPLDRAIKKMNNIKTMTEEETKLWQQIALFMGYGQWELGIQARKTDKADIIRKQEKAQTKKFKTLQKNIDKGTKKKSPIKALKSGVLGKANRDGTIEIAPGLSPEKRKEVINHEKRHQKEIKSGKLDYDDNFVYYGKKKFTRKNGKIAHGGKWKPEGDHSLPWEKFAHNVNNKTI